MDYWPLAYWDAHPSSNTLFSIRQTARLHHPRWSGRESVDAGAQSPVNTQSGRSVTVAKPRLLMVVAFLVPWMGYTMGYPLVAVFMRNPSSTLISGQVVPWFKAGSWVTATRWVPVPVGMSTVDQQIWKHLLYIHLHLYLDKKLLVVLLLRLLKQMMLV